MSTGVRRLILAALSVAVLTGTPACSANLEDNGTGADASPSAESDEEAVRSLVDQIADAWERGDATAYASFHTADADLVDFRGTHVRGRRGIVELLQPLFDGPLQNTRVEARVGDLRFLSPEVAIMHSEGQIVPVGGSSVQTFVVTKGPEGWLIAAFQNTRVETSP